MDNYIFEVTYILATSKEFYSILMAHFHSTTIQTLDLIYKKHDGLQVQLHFSKQFSRIFYQQEIILMQNTAFIETCSVEFQ